MAKRAHSVDVRETVFLSARLLHGGGELVEVEERDDDLGDAEGDDGDVHLRERRRETLCVILRKIVGATINDETSWRNESKYEEV